MLKKFLCFSIIFLISIFILNTSYATDFSVSLDTINSTENSIQRIDDNTTYTSDTTTDIENSTYEDEYSEGVDYVENTDETVASTTTDYDDSAELSISNIINIILIVVGIVLILLGIAIIVKK